MSSCHSKKRLSGNSFSKMLINPVFRVSCVVILPHFRKKVFLLNLNIYPVSDWSLEENEVRTMVDPNSKNDRKLQELMKVRFFEFLTSYLCWIYIISELYIAAVVIT